MKTVLFHGQIHLWRVARGWHRHILTGAFSYEHTGLGFCCFIINYYYYSELFALRISNNFSLILAFLDHVTLPVPQPPPAFGKGHETDIVPVFWTISGVSYPSKETVPSLLSSTPSAAPSQLRYISTFLQPQPHPTPPHPRTEILCCQCLKGLPIFNCLSDLTSFFSRARC